MRFELLKLWRSRRPLLALAILGFFLGLMLLGFYTYAQNETGGQAEFRYTFENRSYFNGLTFGLYGFYFGFLLVLPILVSIEGGVQIAGETSSRTLWLLLARPLSERGIFFRKLWVSSIYIFLLVGLFLALALGVGLLAVGWGELNIYPGVLRMAERHQNFSQNEALGRFLLAWPIASLALFVQLAFSYLCSAWLKQPVNAVGVSMALYLVLYVVCEIHFFAALRPWLFPSYQGCWRELFREQIDVQALASQMCTLAAFGCAFLALALWRFRSREEF